MTAVETNSAPCQVDADDKDSPTGPHYVGLLLPEHLPRALVARLLPWAQPLLWSAEDCETENVLRGTLCSPSLDLDAKARVLDRLGTAGPLVHWDLLEVFEDERKAFSKLVDTEFDHIATCQANALWSAMALAAHRTGASVPLLQAWTRRSVRLMARNGLKGELDKLPPCWWAASPLARWVYRSLYHPEHWAWQG